MFDVYFEPTGTCAGVASGTLIHEAAQDAGLAINMPCGGQGRCGRCAVLVKSGQARRRSTLRLSPADIEAGYALACQTLVEGDLVVEIPRQEKIERRLTTDKMAATVELPFAYDPLRDQTMRSVFIQLEPPSLNDQTDDWSRLVRTLRREIACADICADLTVMRKLSTVLRATDWAVTAILETPPFDNAPWRLVDLTPGMWPNPLYGVAIDIGTTSNVVYLVDLEQGNEVAQAADYNGQISRGEDVISRIIYAGKNGDGLEELQNLALETLNTLLDRVTRRARIDPSQIVKAMVAGNSTMIHLFLGLPPSTIRLMPFVTTANQPPSFLAHELGLAINDRATVDCLPGVASYVGGDITAGVVSSGLADAAGVTLFMDIGTNGETVLGTSDWLIACACSAGPAFEGAGVEHGMRASTGAIEEIWIDDRNAEPSYRVIGDTQPRGICGSGLIALLAELFITNVMDKAGNLRLDLETDRVRHGLHGPEYVVAWAAETAHEKDIVLTRVDIENLLRAKAAVYAGYALLCESVGVDLQEVEEILIGGAFGQYINVEKAIQIGLLPDLPWERFKFMGNTSVRGAYMALLSHRVRRELSEVAGKMTYLELSADNQFYDQFTSALFMPHTDIARFPSVHNVLVNGRRGASGAQPEMST